MKTKFVITHSEISCYTGSKKIGSVTRDNLPIYLQIRTLIEAGKKEEALKLFPKPVSKIKPLKLPKGFTMSAKTKKLSYNRHVWPKMYELAQTVADDANWNAYFPKFLLKLRDLKKADRDMLTEFLLQNKDAIAFDKDGNLLTWKRVNTDLTSLHKNADGSSFYNTIGKKSSMPRESVVRNPHEHCAPGLHVCSFRYLEQWGVEDNTVLLLCKVQPKDIVSVPLDCRLAKLRVCAYTPIAKMDDPSTAAAKAETKAIKNPDVGVRMSILAKGINILNSAKEAIDINDLSAQLGLKPEEATELLKVLSGLSAISISIPEKWTATSKIKVSVKKGKKCRK